MSAAESVARTEAVRRAFDKLAPVYDVDFTESHIGRLQRAAVWRRLERLFKPTARLLDIGCGTGEDALYFSRRGSTVHGIDLSPQMIEIARCRAMGTSQEPRLSFEALGAEELGQVGGGPFDGAYSNFSPLNCVADLGPVARELGRLVRPGGALALCLMNRFCLWETLFYPATLQLHKTFRRLAGEWSETRVGGDEVFRIYYPKVAEVRETFAPWFDLREVPGIGVFVPPSYLEPLAERAPRLTAGLDRVDRLLAARPLFRSLGDHRLLIFRRRES